MVIQKIEDLSRETLSRSVEIREKIVGHRMSFRVTKNGNILFYGKKNKKPLSILDRFMSNLYEDAIKKIISASKITDIPKNILFRTYVKNSRIILTDGLTDKKEELSDDYIAHIANRLGIESQSPLFIGILSEDYSNLSNDEFKDKLISEFGKDNETYDGGFILKFNNGARYKVTNAKIQKYEKHDTSVFELAAIDIINYLNDTTVMSEIEISKSNNTEIRFLSTALQLFERYVNDTNPSTPRWPEFLENAGGICKKLIIHKPVLVYINNNRDREYLLRIFMLVVSGRIRSRGLITSDNELTSYLIHSFIKEFAASRGIIEFETMKNMLKK
jgi:hypothetical protein